MWLPTQGGRADFATPSRHQRPGCPLLSPRWHSLAGDCPGCPSASAGSGGRVSCDAEGLLRARSHRCPFSGPGLARPGCCHRLSVSAGASGLLASPLPIGDTCGKEESGWRITVPPEVHPLHLLRTVWSSRVWFPPRSGDMTGTGRDGRLCPEQKGLSFHFEVKMRNLIKHGNCILLC